MRIGAGRFRNAPLPPAGPGVRPVPGRLRQSLFTRLLPRIEGARVLDLCAGVGGLGLEALSRGASCVVLVESEPRTAAALGRWIADRRLAAQASVVRTDARRGGWPAGPYDLVFVDPPFEMWGGAGGRRPAPVDPGGDPPLDDDGEEDPDRDGGAPADPPRRGPRRRRGRAPDPAPLPPPVPAVTDADARAILGQAMAARAPGGLVIVKLPTRVPVPEDPRWRVIDRRDQGDVAYAILGSPAPPGSGVHLVKRIPGPADPLEC